jgi:hypothetical protein
MQKIYTILALWLVCCWATPCHAAETYPFTLENGNVTEGRISVMDEESLVITKTNGTFTERIDLVYLSQDTLKYIQQHPEYIKKGYHQYVDPFIELPEEEIEPPEITVRQPERMKRPDGKTTFFSTLTTPIGLLILVAIYLGNLFAAFEIAVFRGRPIPLVCGVSAVLPFIGPILFISMPGIETESTYDASYDDGFAAATESAPESAPAPGAPAAKSGLGLAKGVGAGVGGSGGGLAGSVFTKDDTQFNRSFIETKFSEFFRVVPSPSIKNLVLAFKTVKTEFVATRITRISGSDLHLQLQQGSKEVSIGFGEIVRIEVRNK